MGNLLEDVFDGVDTALDQIDIAELINDPLGQGGSGGPLEYVNAVIDGGKVGWGGSKAIDYFENDDYHPEAWDGLNTAIDGGLGLTGMLPGNAGQVGKAASAGYTVGNWLAPVVYGEEPEGEHYEQVPEDGIFKPTTGNKFVDWMFGVD